MVMPLGASVLGPLRIPRCDQQQPNRQDGAERRQELPLGLLENGIGFILRHWRTRCTPVHYLVAISEIKMACI